jgi:hypothetical protein
VCNAIVSCMEYEDAILTKNVICVTIPKYHAISLKKFHLLEL